MAEMGKRANREWGYMGNMGIWESGGGRASESAVVVDGEFTILCLTA